MKQYLLLLFLSCRTEDTKINVENIDTANGFSDADGDGYLNERDAFPLIASQWNDSDMDGFGDDSEGFEADACPNQWGIRLSFHFWVALTGTEMDGATSMMRS